ncbi:protein of unknown function [Pseudodesulfovibrio piezophilus C1TLV30]|uniref:Uncharacterized protein n=1 Tax=Pseudodesulfovibrio piezophilus (strain DSM 21447 / JCM 15486 / C1TLV30) TaxID=1322246 RepID=M1WKZ7_PSEP2|nr:protein of unknown function [Pseudodesulfovibrio piezophilus C1TLV30]
MVEGANLVGNTFKRVTIIIMYLKCEYGIGAGQPIYGCMSSLVDCLPSKRKRSIGLAVLPTLIRLICLAA